MTRYVKCFRDFSGGLSEAANDNMADNQLAAAQNIVPGDGFGLARASGLKRDWPQIAAIAAGCRVSDIVQLTLANGDTLTLAFVLLSDDTQRLYRLDADAAGWTLAATGLSRCKDLFVQAHKLYWLTGSKLKCYDGTTVSEVAVTPEGESATAEELAVWAKVEQAVAVEQRGQRWFYATVGNEVIFSEIGDPTRVTPTNIINVNTKDNDSITALREFNDGLLIFKRRSVHLLTGWDFAAGSDIRLTRLMVTTGTAFPRSVQTVENGVLYLGQNGLYRLYVPQYSSLVAAQNVSENKISRALFAPGQPTDVCACVWDNVYRLSLLYGDAEHTLREYRYYPRLDAFFGPYTNGATSYAALDDGRLYVGLRNAYIGRDDRDSRAYVDSASGQPCAIPILAATKGFDVSGRMAQQVKIKRVLLAARQYLQDSSRLSVRIKADYADAQFELAPMSLDESLVYGEGEFGATFWGWKDTVTKALTVNRKAQRISFFISDDAIDEPALVYGLAIVYRLGKISGDRSRVTQVDVEYTD